MSYRIAVVGFGVGGAAAALELARSGHEVIVSERSSAGHAQGAGLLLQPSGQRVLARLGLLEAVVAGAEPIDELFAETGTGRALSRLRYRDLGEDTHAYGVGRSELVEPLRRAAVGAGATVRFETTVAGVNGDLGLVTLGEEPDCTSESFDLILVAEGAHARITAQSLGLIGRRHEYSHAAFWAAGPCTAVRRRLHQVVRGTRRLVGLLPLGGGRAALFWGLRKDEREPTVARGFAAWRREVLALHPLAAELFEELESFDDLSFATYGHARAARWSRGRAVLLGDAAHPMSPHTGQGANLALLDAARLGDTLASSSGPAQAFAAYEARRRAELRYYSAASLLLTPFFQSDGVLKGFARDLGLPLLMQSSLLRRLMVDTASGLRRGLFGGRIDV